MEQKEGKGKIIIIIVLGVCLALSAPIFFALGFGCKSALVKAAEERERAKITSTYITSKLQEVSELTSEELNYHGVITYTKGSIPWLTQTGFTMNYNAVVRAGIDVSDIQVEVTDTQVILTMPKSVIQSVYVDPSSIVFYDQKYALLNLDQKDETMDAMQDAQDDVLEHINQAELEQAADAHSEELIRGLLENAIGDRELVINGNKTNQPE